MRVSLGQNTQRLWLRLPFSMEFHGVIAPSIGIMLELCSETSAVFAVGLSARAQWQLSGSVARSEASSGCARAIV